MSLAEVSLGAAWHWLLTPISGSSVHHIAPAVAWHGRLMVFAWGLLMPVIVLIARFYKVTPKQDWPRALDNPFWFVTHRRWGYWLGAIAAVGLFAVLPHAIGGDSDIKATRSGSGHHFFGWALLVLCAVQLLSSALRGSHGGPVNPFTRQPRPPEQWPGDHYCMTRRRVSFEYLHKWLGWLMAAWSIAAILTGLWSADAPRWMWIALGLWWFVQVAAFAILQLQGRCIDTYQAIWGVDPDLPGNRRLKPIGFGIRRYSPHTVDRAAWPKR